MELILGFIVLLACLFMGIKHGGIGLAVISGIGLMVYTFIFHFKPGSPPIGVMLTILAVVTCAGFLQTSGGLTVLDVRDLATVVTAAVAAGQGPRRFILGGHFFTTRELADLLERVTGRVRRLPAPPRLLRTIGRANDVVMRVLPVDLSLTYEGMVFLTHGIRTDDSGTLDTFGLSLRPPDETVADTLRWLLGRGLLKPRHVPRLSPLR